MTLNLMKCKGGQREGEILTFLQPPLFSLPPRPRVSDTVWRKMKMQEIMEQAE